MKNMLRSDRKGSLLINSVILLLVLILTGAAFLKWTADEGYQARFDLARTQAYYIAQKGVLETGLCELRSRTDVDLPSKLMVFPDSRVQKYGEFDGFYTDCKLMPVWQMLSEDLPMNEIELVEEYTISATGVVELRQPNGDIYEVARSVNLTARKPSLSKYFYFTHCEQTPFGEIVWFHGRDKLYGPVRSNDQIAIKQNPEFFSDVISSAGEFNRGVGFSPIFHVEPQLNAPALRLEERAYELRLAAQTIGTYFDNHDGLWTSRIEGSATGWRLMQWQVGTSFDEENLARDVTLPYSPNGAIFVEGDLALKGENISGRTSLGCEGNMRLIDDVRYVGFGADDLSATAQANVYYLVGTTSILGLISESNIQIANTDANGKGNGRIHGPWNDHSNKHIIITAALITLGGSVEIENQNNRPTDPFGWDGYWWCDPAGDHPNEQDERGAIYLRGVILQLQRGYVHRGFNNCGSTGYDKEYAYDIRMWKTPPPNFPKEVRADGRYDFFITSSWDQNPEQWIDFH